MYGSWVRIPAGSQSDEKLIAFFISVFFELLIIGANIRCMKKKYEIENIEIVDFAAEGKCIARHEAEVIFVDGSKVCPGDQVKLLVTKSKKRFSEGRVLDIHRKSEGRTEPFCSHFGECGGCKWQHVP